MRMCICAHPRVHAQACDRLYFILYRYVCVRLRLRVRVRVFWHHGSWPNMRCIHVCAHLFISLITETILFITFVLFIEEPVEIPQGNAEFSEYISKYKVPDYYVHNEHSFYDIENELIAHRLPQPDAT